MKTIRISNFFILFLLTCTIVTAQIDISAVHTNPYSTIYNLLFYLQPGSYEPNRAALSIPPDEENSIVKAKKIKEYLDGKGLYVDVNELPKNADHIDSVTGQQVYTLFSSEPMIMVEKIGSNWYFSPSTCRVIDELHRSVYPFDAQWSTWFNTPFWQTKLVGLRLWKWLGIVVVSLISYLSYKFVLLMSRSILGRVLVSPAHKIEEYESKQMQLSRILALLAITWLIKLFVPLIKLSPWFNTKIITALSIVFIVFITMGLAQIVRLLRLYLERQAEKTDSTLDDQLLPVVEKLSLIILWGLGFIYVLDYLNVNVTAMIAGLSVGGLALALAAQDTVKNFFGSIVIFLDRPFQIGDWIQYENVDGTVEEVGVRSTRVRTFSNSITYVPNARLADSVVNNMGLRKYRRYSTKIGITYDTSPEIMDDFVEGIREIIRLHPHSRKDNFEVYINELDSSSINILVYVFFEVSTWTDELKCRHQIIYAILKLANGLGVKFAFPTQTLHIEDTSHIEANPVDDNTVSKTYRQSVMDDIKTYFSDTPT